MVHCTVKWSVFWTSGYLCSVIMKLLTPPKQEKKFCKKKILEMLSHYCHKLSLTIIRHSFDFLYKDF